MNELFRFLRRGVAGLLSVLCLAAAGQGSAVGADKAASGTSDLLQVEKLRTELDKLKVETKKLQQEQVNLEANNQALTAFTRWATPWLGSLGAMIGFGAALAATFLGWRLNRNLNNNQRLKLQQDRELERQKHIMVLFENLGSDRVTIQLAGAAMLIQRLKCLYADGNPPVQTRNGAEKLEAATIVQALVTVTKRRQTERKVEPVLLKFVADNLVEALGAMKKASPAGHRR